MRRKARTLENHKGAASAADESEALASSEVGLYLLLRSLRSMADVRAARTSAIPVGMTEKEERAGPFRRTQGKRARPLH